VTGQIPSRSTPAVPSAERSQVHQRGDQQEEQIHSRDCQVAIDHPRVHQRGERKKEEAQDQYEDAAEGPIQIMREQEQEGQSKARKRENHDQE
jgi:hypothetical protein